MPIPAVAIFDGGSITHNTGTGSASWPSAVCASLGWPCTNLASSGKAWQTLLVQAPTTVDPLFVAGQLNIAVAYQAYTDLALGAPPIHVLRRTARWHSERRAKGFLTVAATAIPGTMQPPPTHIPQSQFDAARDELNALIRLWAPAFCDRLVDLAADPRIGQRGQNLNATYYLDQVHFTNAGIAYVAGLFQPALAALAA